ncbi:protein kinase, partial [Acinetobacter baumannii]
MADEKGESAEALTQVGAIAFTPDYASPEQVRGESLGTASDVYSLGVVLYELLCGHRPHKRGRNPAASLTPDPPQGPAAPSQRVDS